MYPIRQHEVAITMACSDSYKNIMGVLLQSIITNADAQENYDIVILEYGISKSDQSRISRFYQRENISVRFYSVREQIEGKDLYVHGYLSVMTYARLLIPQIFENFERVVYLDCDMVCNSDIAQLFHADMQDKPLGAVADTVLNMEAWHNPNSEETKQYLKETVGITTEGRYFNGGVILFDIDRLREDGEKLLACARERQWRWADQDVLNHIYKERVFYFDLQWNVIVISNIKQRKRYLSDSKLYPDYERALEEPCIIHYAGEMLPCYRRNVPLGYKFLKYAEGSLYAEQFQRKKFKRSVGKRVLLDQIARVIPYDSKLRKQIKKISVGR